MPTKEQTKKIKAKSLATYYIKATKYRAKSKNREFNLTEDDFNQNIVARCPILGIKLNYHSEGWNKNDTASIDRIDNSKGYVSGNIWVISNLANSMKRNSTPKQLIKFARWVLRTYGKSSR